MENRPKCVIITVKLQDNGIAIYMGMVAASVSLTDVTLCCKNTDGIQYNGLVVLSPAEDDGHWYYCWNGVTAGGAESPDNRFKWSFDNGHGSYEYEYNSKLLGSRNMYDLPNNIVITRVYLNTGYWSKNIFCQLMGPRVPPGSVFKLQGQKYVNFCCDNNYFCRIPVYKLAPEAIEQNLSTSTDPYSSVRTYVVGDYCTFNGYVYKCITAIPQPEPFDDSKWVQTTVPNELLTAGDHIYGA